jgi:L-asparaginase II
VNRRPAIVTVRRGGLAESTHRVHVAVTDAGGRLVAAAGDPARVTVMRSAAKPFQAQPLLDSGAFAAWGMDDRMLAVACASHLGLDEHVVEVRRGLAAAGVAPDALCNAPGPVEARLRHNCSGNHMGFLALSAHHGWPLDGYRAPAHPSQRAALDVVAAIAGVAATDVATCTDGCGVLAFALPLAVIAAMFARLPAALPRQHAAMRAHPELVRGEGALDTELMRAIPGCVAKAGAEAVEGIGLADAGLGIALRVEDGTPRALAPVAIAVLGQLLGWSDPPAPLAAFAAPDVRGTTGEPVGRIEADVVLGTAG